MTLSDIVARPITRIILVAVPILIIIAVVALQLGMRDARNSRTGPSHPAPSHQAPSGPGQSTSKPAGATGASSGPSSDPSGKTASSGATAQPSQSASAGPDAAGGLPSGWHTYKDGSGFSIGLPGDWKQSRRRGLAVWFTGPNKAFLLIDQTSTPKKDAKADWKQQEKSRKYTFPGYKKVAIKSVDYFTTAADWEFTYNLGGDRVHVVNRGFVTGAHHGYAIYFNALETRWKQDRHFFDTFTATFKPAK
jgi:hypothetical protein